MMKKTTLMITGANGGIGRAITSRLAEQGYRLILVCRPGHEGETFLQELKTTTRNRGLYLYPADLSSQASIRALSDKIHLHHGYLDALINNAGVYRETRSLTPEGIEETFAVNVMAPFMLTHLLADLLAKGKGGRVINVGSYGERFARIQLDDLMYEKGYAGNAVYNQSKLALAMVTYRFAEILKERGISVNCIHPGATRTGLVHDEDFHKMKPPLRWIYQVASMFSQSPESAAKAITRLAVHPKYEQITGAFFHKEMISASSLASRDPRLQKIIWSACEDMLIPEASRP